jgi:hypothetical protein
MFFTFHKAFYLTVTAIDGEVLKKKSIDPELLKILACPVCKRDLKLKGNELICVGCRRRYPIKNGIPYLLPDELK